MKGKVLLIASAAILGIGAVTHISGHAPKCPLRRAIEAEKPVVTAKTDIVLAGQIDLQHGSDGTVKTHHPLK